MTSTTNTGISFTTLLAVLFIGLKLAKVIVWPWIWVLAPLWLPLGVVLAILLIIFLIALVK